MTQGAISAFTSKPDGYDFGKTYTTLEAAYRGQHKFDWRVEPLNNLGAQFNWLPNPNIGVLNAKYLIESFVIPNMNNADAFISDFKGYSSTVFASVGTVGRAINQLSKSLKIS
jgi:hypothetical protein